MTTETKTEKTTTSADTAASPNNNKTVFAPLGKYAVIAVIMVSIIVTTAIMLDKQLSASEEKMAAIESEMNATVAAMETSIQTPTTSSTTEAKAESTSTAVSTANEESTTIKAETTASADTSTATVLTQQVATTESPAVLVETDNQLTEPTQSTAAATEKNRFVQQIQVRRDAFKAEQKQRMTEIFARIKVLESDQLDQYKANQEKHITHLRGLIAKQQQMIEALVSRNSDLFELRAANMQRNQSNREQILNRI